VILDAFLYLPFAAYQGSIRSGCSDRLDDYWVFVLDTPFSAADTPATLQNCAGTWSSHQMGAPNPSTTITLAAQVQGR
jgi:hypothetical protein